MAASEIFVGPVVPLDVNAIGSNRCRQSVALTLDLDGIGGVAFQAISIDRDQCVGNPLPGLDRGLGDLRVFYYRVIAVNAAGGLGVATSEPVRAVTKPEPLPPIGLRTVEQSLGANELAWDRNVEEDIIEYQLYRTLEGEDSPTLIASLSADETTADDDAVAAGQRVTYTLVAIDRDGLESDLANPIEVESERYGLSATVRPDGVHLAWIDRADEGFRGGHVFRTALLQNKNLGFSLGNSFVDAEVRAGATYSYTVVLEKTDQSLAPRSAPVEISIPERPAD